MTNDTKAQGVPSADESLIVGLRREVSELRQRAMRAHQIVNLLRIAHPEIGEIGDDGCLHEAVHDIMRVEPATNLEK